MLHEVATGTDDARDILAALASWCTGAEFLSHGLRIEERPDTAVTIIADDQEVFKNRVVNVVAEGSLRPVEEAEAEDFESIPF